VHDIVSSAVGPARVISGSCHLAGMRIGTRDPVRATVLFMNFSENFKSILDSKFRSNFMLITT
jgi:hypothetical protein